MSTYLKRYAFSAIALSVLAGCSGSDENLGELGFETTAPLVCQSPEVINEAGTGCEVPVANCPLPLTDNPDVPGTCVEFTGPWPDGGNDLTMPDPVYTAAAGDVQGFSEVVYFFNHPDFETIGTDGWGLHAWNGSGTLCQAYGDFDVPDGGTDWGVPIAPVGEDPNYGLYFVMPLRPTPICGNMIPYNFNEGKQADVDIQVDMAVIETGNFFVLARNNEDRYDPGIVFPYPRTYAAINSLPDDFDGGGDPEPVVCEFPEVPNEDDTECLPPLELDPFEPGAVTLYLRGGFNDWGNDADGNFALNDGLAFHYANGVYTTTLSVPANADGYDFKIADQDWSETYSFGGPQGGIDERTVPFDEPWALVSGRTADDQDIEGNMRIAPEEDVNIQFTINASDPENLTMTMTQTPVGVPLYIRGSMNDWGSDADGNFSQASGTTIMRYQGSNIYSAQLALTMAEEAYQFKVADPGWTAETNFGALTGEEILALNEAKTLIFGEEGQNIQYTALEDETVTLTLDVSDMTAPVLTASKVPYGTTAVYVRGSMNGWGNDSEGNFALTDADAFEYLGDGQYQTVISLDAATHNFKVADSDWSTVNFGEAPGEAGTVNLNEAKVLTAGSESGNLVLETPAASNYVFSLNASVPAAPELTVRDQEAYAGTPIYVRGSLNDWGTANEMTYMGEGVYQATITLGTSTAEEPYMFKVASEDWEVANFGGNPAEDSDHSVVVGDTKLLTPGGDSANLSLVIEVEGDYVFSIDTNNINNPTLSVFSADLYSSVPLYLRGSMNDWGTANEMTANGGATYSLDIELGAESYAFKVASEDWEAANLGAPVAEGSTPVVTLGQPKIISSGEAEASNIELTLDADGNYRFNVWHISPLKPVIEVSTVD